MSKEISENKAWGYYTVDDESTYIDETFEHRPNWKLKTLYIRPNSCTSYQFHHNRDEVWLVKKGKGTAIIGLESFVLCEGVVLHVDQGVWHQIINGTQEELVIHEIQHGMLCKENDIERQ